MNCKIIIINNSDPDDVGQYLPDYVVLHSRRQSSLNLYYEGNMRSVIFKTTNNLYKIRTDDRKSFF
jgi:hypothetical protein